MGAEGAALPEPDAAPPGLTVNDDRARFDDFWEASSLSIFNIGDFSRALSVYEDDDKELLLEYPTSPRPLPSPSTRLGRIARRRHSGRTFSGAEVSERELGALLSSLRAWNGLEHRGYPSAGATYVTEVFCVGFHAASLTGTIAYYDAERHGLVEVSRDAPTWDDVRARANATIDGTPGLLLLFVAFPGRATVKYGERGGRFALLEVGAAMQQVSLAIAESRRLKGVILGGLLDESWVQSLGLGGTDAHIVVGYIIGK